MVSSKFHLYFFQPFMQLESSRALEPGLHDAEALFLVSLLLLGRVSPVFDASFLGCGAPLLGCLSNGVLVVRWVGIMVWDSFSL